MPHPQLDIEEALPTWNRLNDVELTGVTPQHIPRRGVGLVAERNLKHDDESTAPPTLARIPHDLVLSHTAVEDFAKVDGHFRELLEKAGRKSTRGDACLFLLAQRALASQPRTSAGTGLVHTPWAEYVKFLPSQVPVPTLWSERERRLLRGTSLEAALFAKIQALIDEYDEFHAASSNLPFWNALLWDHNDGREPVTLSDWFMVDAWYRSRSLELPHAGESMVPVLDLANHSSTAPNAYYDEAAFDDPHHHQGVKLLLRPGATVPAGEEVTISYGEAKSGAEMLFSYGFVDPARTADHVALPLEALGDDPLAQAKMHVFSGPRTIQLGRTSGKIGGGGGTADAAAGETTSTTNATNTNTDTNTIAHTPSADITWESPFAWLACLNEEDGLAFRVLQDTGGNRELKVFWQDEDVTARTDALAELVGSHPLAAVFRLRVVAVVEDVVASHLARVQTDWEDDDHAKGEEQGQEEGESGSIREECVEAASAVKEQEASVLAAAVKMLEEEKSRLLEDTTVVAYLGSMEVSQNEQAGDAASNESDDFS